MDPKSLKRPHIKATIHLKTSYIILNKDAHFVVLRIVAVGVLGETNA